jgi:hypothetical protein
MRVGSVLKLVAQPTIDDLAGIAAGKDGEDYRDRSDRTLRAPTARR